MTNATSVIQLRPESLTPERAESFLPRMEIDAEWERQHEAGTLPDGLSGMSGMLTTIWPDAVPTREEAEWILALLTFGTWRWMASVVLDGDDNQIAAMHLIEASQRMMDIDISELDEWNPPCGPCAFCGFGDKRHRLWDVWIARHDAGEESAEELAEDYDEPLAYVRAVLRLRPYEAV